MIAGHKGQRMKWAVALLLTTTPVVAQRSDMSTALRAANELKAQMRNPYTFKVLHVVYFHFNRKGNIVDTYCYEYLTQNMFGAMSREFATYHIDRSKNGKEKTGFILSQDMTVPERYLFHGCRATPTDKKHPLDTSEDITESFNKAAK